MMKLKAVILLSCASALLLFPSLVVASEPAEQPVVLHQLNVLFRHGDRMPEIHPERFPNDPNMHESFQPMGSGGLTNEGKRRMYRLGELLRRRYDESLGREYAQDRVHASSSGLPRTIMSSQLVLAALYPPSLLPAKDRWHPKLDWQPIPTYYQDFRRDKYFNQDKCERFVGEYNRVLSSKEVQEKISKFEAFLEEVRIASGRSKRMTLYDALLLHNNLDIERRLGLKMEPWMVETLNGTRLKELRRLFYEIQGYNDKLRRYQSGPLIRQINEDMIKGSNETSNYPRKVTLYSGHDKTIIGVLQSLNMYDSHFPEFGSALVFELVSSNGHYYVKILYYLGIPEEIKILTIPGCEALCPLGQYLNLTKSAQISDDDDEGCVIKSDKYFTD